MQHSNNLQMHGVHKINCFNLCLTQSIQVIILLFLSEVISEYSV